MTYIEQGIKYMQDENYEMAVKAFNDAIEAEPDNPVGYINFGHVLAHLNEDMRAKDFYEKALELDPKAATAYYGLGNLLFEKAQYKQAIRQYTKAIDLGLTEADVYFMIGFSHVKREDFKLALPFLMRASELSPSDSDIAMQYGLALAELSQLEEAYQVFDGIYKSYPTHADALYNRALCDLFLENTDQAIKDLNHVLDLEPEHTLAQSTLMQIEQILDQQ